MNVHIIEVDFVGMDLIPQRNALGKAIGTLAQREKETVFFHDYSGPLGGIPAILLECSDDFLGKVKQLPGFKTAFPVWDNAPTERSQTAQDFYMNPAPPAFSGHNPPPPL